MISNDILVRPLLEHLRDATTMVVSDPEPMMARPEKVYYALKEAYDALHTMILATHSSSSDSYAVQDLPPSDRATLDRIKHNLNIIGMLYGPQSA